MRNFHDIRVHFLQEFSEMVVAAANLVTKHGIDKLDIDTDYLSTDHNGKRRKHKFDDDIMSMNNDADADGMLKVSWIFL